MRLAPQVMRLTVRDEAGRVETIVVTENHPYLRADGTVDFLRAVALGRDHQNAVLREPAARQTFEALADARRQGRRAAHVEAQLRSQIASFKVPRGFVRVEALPRTALGKVQKHLLPGVDARR